MDLLYFVDERLRFIRYFYETAAPTFTEIKRKIEANEEPYVDRRDPEYAEEPAFWKEFEDADIATDLIGATCLGMVQAILHSFLEEYIREIGRKDLLVRLPEMKKGSWFENYLELFATFLGIDCRTCGVDVGLLEQVILTRNDFFHNVEITSAYTYQGRKHAQKYPESVFSDSQWKSLFDPNRLIVQREKLEQALDAVRTLCEYLEGQRMERRQAKEG